MARWRSTAACERASQLISMELDGELSEFERAALARHLEGCADCRESQTLMREIARGLRESRTFAPPAGLSASLGASLAPRRRLPGGRRAAVVFALAATVGSLAAAFALPQGSAPASASVLASATPLQRLEFVAAEHARIEPRVSADAPKISPFAARLVVESV
jgi:anti-sigma factor RsiW